MIKQEFHRLLRRQILTHFGENYKSTPELKSFLDAVNEAYKDFDKDLDHAERILKESSSELFKKNKELQTLNKSMSNTISEQTSDIQRIAFNLQKAENLAGMGNFTWNSKTGELELSQHLIEIAREYGIDYSKGGFNVVEMCEQADFIKESILTAIQTREKLRIERIKLKGKEVYFLLEGEVVNNEKNSETLFFGVIQVITENVLSEIHNNQQKEFYENILNKLPTDIVVFDRNTKYLFVNSSAIKDDFVRNYMLGKDEMEYARFRKLDPKFHANRMMRFKETVEKKHQVEWEDSYIKKDGSREVKIRRLFPILNDEGEVEYVISYGIEITDRKEIEEKQLMLVDQYAYQNAKLIDFTNIVSHNLRGPLVNIDLLVKYLQATDDREEKDNLISKLGPIIESLHEIFDGLIESIQVQNDTEVEWESNVLNENIDKILKSMTTEINDVGAKFNVQCGEHCTIHFPSKYLDSILYNLISNAIKYRSPERQLLVNIKAEKTDQTLLMSIEDNGLGFDVNRHKNNLFKIGKIFHKNPGAKGFGLFMTKTQIEAMGGEIWVESEVGKGSTFYVKFVNQ